MASIASCCLIIDSHYQLIHPIWNLMDSTDSINNQLPVYSVIDELTKPILIEFKQTID